MLSIINHVKTQIRDLTLRVEAATNDEACGGAWDERDHEVKREEVEENPEGGEAWDVHFDGCKKLCDDR